MNITKSSSESMAYVLGLVVGVCFAIMGAYLYLWPAIQVTGQYFSAQSVLASGGDLVGMKQFFINEIERALPLIWLKGLFAAVPGLALALYCKARIN